jgi:hypothetical protein
MTRPSRDCSSFYKSAKSGVLLGYAVGDSIFSKFFHERRKMNVWYSGIIQSIPNVDARRKFYTVLYEDKDLNLTMVAKELQSRLPSSGVAYDGGNFSRIRKGVIVRDPVESPTVSLPPPLLPQLSYEPLASDLPSIPEIVAKRSAILKHIPFTCRGDFGRALNAVLGDILFFNDSYAWTTYFLFVPCVLLPLGRGVRHKKDLERHTKARIAKWNGDRELDLRTRTLARVEMWRALPSPADGSFVQDPVKRCKSLAAEGRYALACRALADVEAVAPFSPSTFDILVS